MANERDVQKQVEEVHVRCQAGSARSGTEEKVSFKASNRLYFPDQN
jgi:hypothetical protein